MNNEIKEILEYISSRTVDDILLPDYFERIEDYITNLQEENERVSNLYETYEEANELWIKKCENYKSRIDKAIEYINTHYLNANEPELLNILQGEDKE